MSNKKARFFFMYILIMKTSKRMLKTHNLVMIRYSTFGSSPRPPRALRDDILIKNMKNYDWRNEKKIDVT